MKFILLCILLFACNFSGNAIHFFNGTYEEALQLAKKEKKNLFISFTASWCGPCRMMKKVVFEDPQVVRYADQHYICLNADIEYPEFRLLQCRVNPNRAGIIPHICILTPDGKIIKESSSVTTGQMMSFSTLSCICVSSVPRRFSWWRGFFSVSPSVRKDRAAHR